MKADRDLLDELVGLLGIQTMQEGDVTREDFAARAGIGYQKAAKNLDKLAEEGTVVRVSVLHRGRWKYVYRRPG